MTKDEANLIVERIIRETFAKARISLSKPALRLPSYSWRLGGRCAGRAYYRPNEIGLNWKLFCDNTPDFISDTIPHECAHLIAYQIYGGGISGHGYHWKHVMLSLGLEPIRCHNYDTKERFDA